MTSITWKGTTGDYTLGTNWVGGSVPGSADTGIFDATGITQAVTIASPETAGGWTFNGGAYTIAVSSNVSLDGAGTEVTAGSAHITVSSVALTFQGHSSAGNATIEATSTGIVSFAGNSDGGNARLISDAVGLQIGLVAFNSSSGPLGDNNVHAGSIEGTGAFFFGLNNLTVGSNNLSTICTGSVSGVGSLTKVGTGTLTFAGVATFFNAGIVIDGGVLDLASEELEFEPSITFGAGAATLRIEAISLTRPGDADFDPPIHGFGKSDTIDLPSIPFVAGASATYNTATQTLTVTSGGATAILDTVVAPALTHFAVLGDHTGGSRVVPAIIENRPHKHVDAKHHPLGQPGPTAGPEVIVALGANDTVKGVGGNDTLEGGARGDVLYSAPGDSLVFESRNASPPSHPDVIMNFHHGHQELIDLYDLRNYVPGHQALVFIGSQSFAQYHHKHHGVFGMVRYAGGEVQINFDHHLKTEFAIVMHGAPPLHASDFILSGGLFL